MTILRRAIRRIPCSILLIIFFNTYLRDRPIFVFGFVTLGQTTIAQDESKRNQATT
jgi:hypothetical protein